MDNKFSVDNITGWELNTCSVNRTLTKPTRNITSLEYSHQQMINNTSLEYSHQQMINNTSLEYRIQPSAEDKQHSSTLQHEVIRQLHLSIALFHIIQGNL